MARCLRIKIVTIGTKTAVRPATTNVGVNRVTIANTRYPKMTSESEPVLRESVVTAHDGDATGATVDQHAEHDAMLDETDAMPLAQPLQGPLRLASKL